VPSAATPLNGSRDPADSKAFLNNAWQRRTATVLSLETAAASFNKLGATRDASDGVVLSSFFFHQYITHSTLD
jgi:hypothetical protein